MIKTLFVLLIFFYHSNCFSQKGFDTIKFAGKWTVCVEIFFEKDFNCKNGYVTFDFFEDGTFKDPRPSLDGGGEHEFSMGKWKFEKGELTIDYDDTEFSQDPPVRYNIIFINKNRFYSTGKEGPNGISTYTYFQKIE